MIGSIKYDKIGLGYNNTRTADPYLLSRMHHYLYQPGDRNYLDIGCGSGNYTIELAKKGMQFIGIEPSLHMLKLAKSSASTVNWIQGTAEQMPVNDQSMDAVLASLTLHHWTSLREGFKEINRVLRKHGTITIFTSTSEQMEGYWLKEYFPKMIQDSIDQMPSHSEIIYALETNNFVINKEEKYNVRSDLQDKFLYVGKNKPSLYLDKNIRNGISSFSDLANQNEVKKGLAQLESDINTGKVDEHVLNYQNELGDYLFIVANKQ